MGQGPSRTPQFRGGDSRDFQTVPRPVAAMARDLPPGHVIDWHAHPRYQFLYAVRGVMVLGTAHETWVVPPQRGVWIPPGVRHVVEAAEAVQMRTLYVRADAAPRAGERCEALEVTPLLRELILRATAMPVEYDEAGADGRIAALILDELAALAPLPYNVPMPTSEPLAGVCRAILATPGEAHSVESIARASHVSARTLARRFRRETGMSLAAWRRRARLLNALTMISGGRAILDVALELGYDSPSAFSAMFRRELGVPPTHFRPGREARA